MSPMLTTVEERNWGVICHLSSFCGYLGIPFGHVVGPLVVWLVKREQSPFVDEIGKENLNYNISILLWAVISLLFTLCIVGIIPLIGLAIMDVVVRILGAVSASRGEVYRYPLTIRFIA